MADEAGGGALSPATAKAYGQTLRLSGQIVDLVAPGTLPTPEDREANRANRLLGTPRSSDGMQRALRDPAGIKNGNARGRLEDQVSQQLLPTPVAQPSGNTPEDHLRKKPGREVVTDLAIVVENGLLETGGRLLPTPDAYAGNRGGSQSPAKRRAGGRTVSVADVVEKELPLLPTVMANEAEKATNLQNAEQRGRTGQVYLTNVVQTVFQETTGTAPNPHALDPLPEPGALLPTPISSDWKTTGPADSNRETVQLRAIGALLPTPTTQESHSGPSQAHRKTPPLNARVLMLPTPRAADHKAGGANPTAAARVADGTATLGERVAMMPTPRASDGEKGGPNQRGSKGDLTMPSLAPLLEDVAWGEYEPAIRRWETCMGPAPSPVAPGAKGQPRLSPLFTEWMMGVTAGWITAPEIGLTRNEQLKACGNGVVTQQAEAALAWMLDLFEQEDAA